MPTEIKNRITDSAMQNFSQYGYSRVTVDEIAKLAGVSKKTIYQHFKSKEEILLGVIKCKKETWDTLFDDIYELDVDFLEKMRLIGYRVAEHITTAPLVLIKDLENNHPSLAKKLKDIRKESIQKVFSKFLKIGKSANYFRQDVPEDIVIEMYFCMMNHILIIADEKKADYSLKKLYDYFGMIFFEGIFSREGFIKFLKNTENKDN